MRGAAICLVLCVAAGCHTDPCKGVTGTCIAVHVVGDRVTTVDQLGVRVSGSFTAGPQLTPNPPQKQTLPIDVGVTFDAGQQGSVTIAMTGLLGGAPIASGSTIVKVTSGGRQSVTLTLEPRGASGGGDMAVANGDMSGSDAAAGVGDMAGVVADLSRVPDMTSFVPALLVPGSFTAFAVAPDASTIATTGADAMHTVAVWDGTSGSSVTGSLATNPSRYWVGNTGTIVFTYYPGGDMAVSPLPFVWARANGMTSAPLTDTIVTNGGFGPQVAPPVLISNDGTVIFYDTPTKGTQWATNNNATSSSIGSTLSHGFASPGNIGYARLSSSDSIERIAAAGTTNTICTVCTPFAFSPDGSRIATATMASTSATSGTIAIGSTASTSAISPVAAAPTDVDTTLAPLFSADGNTVYYIDTSYGIRQVPAAGGTVTTRLMSAGAQGGFVAAGPGWIAYEASTGGVSGMAALYLLADGATSVVTLEHDSGGVGPSLPRYSIVGSASSGAFIVEISTTNPPTVAFDVFNNKGVKLTSLPPDALAPVGFLDATHIFYGDSSNHLNVWDLNAGSATIVASNVTAWQGVNGGRVYWLQATGAGSGIYSATWK